MATHRPGLTRSYGVDLTDTAGGAYFADTSAHAGLDVAAIQVLADAKFHTLTGNISGVANETSGSAPTIPAGTVLRGAFTALHLHSGAVIAYAAL